MGFKSCCCLSPTPLSRAKITNIAASLHYTAVSGSYQSRGGEPKKLITFLHPGGRYIARFNNKPRQGFGFALLNSSQEQRFKPVHSAVVAMHMMPFYKENLLVQMMLQTIWLWGPHFFLQKTMILTHVSFQLQCCGLFQFEFCAINFKSKWDK